MIYKKNDSNYQEPQKGIKLKSLTYGPNTHLIEFNIEKGVFLKEHHHPHEQIGYMIKGKMILTVDGVGHELESGDSWCIEGNIAHSAEFLQDSLLVEVFHPQREELK